MIIQATDEFSDAEESQYSFRELMDLLLERKEVILTIPADQMDDLRKGLSVRKSKDNVKLKSAGLMPDKGLLSFNFYPIADKPNFLKAHIKYGPKKSINVIDVQLPDDSI